MKILVVGCGSIGRRHMKNLLRLGHTPVGVDINSEYRAWVEKNLKVRAYGSVKKAIEIEKPAAGLVCTPPSTHIGIAKMLLDNNLHVFIEKPLSNSLAGIDALVREARKKKRVIAVGYNLRFNRGIVKLRDLVRSGAIGKMLSARIVVGQYLPDWRPWQDYRKSYTASRKLGGGVILDASHELDYARWLMGEVSRVTCVAKNVSSLSVETEDNAEIILEFKSGAVANVHLDFVRRDYRRGCEIVGDRGTLELFFGDRIEIYDAKSKRRRSISVKSDPNDMYVEELKHFLKCIGTRGKPRVDAADAKKTLVLALVAKRSAERGKSLEAVL